MKPMTPCRPSPLAGSAFFRKCAESLPITTQRHQSSYRRSRSHLNVKPDASFLPSTTEAHDHIIFNPPPSAPNVYHTPAIFLPKSDARRQLYDSRAPVNLQSPTASSESSSQQRLAPTVRKPYEKRYHLTAQDMEEMRRLRREDPVLWSASKLAKKFDCSSLFVGVVTEGIAKKKKEQQRQVTEVVQSRWGKKRREAREDRSFRRERWYSDA